MAGLEYKIRLMCKDDIPQILDILRENETHLGTHNLCTWLEVDPEGLFVAVTDSDEVLGCCAAIIHHDDLAYVGLYYVKKKYQRQGIGTQIWTRCNEHVGTRNLAVNSWPAMVERYRTKLGFPVLENEWVGFKYFTTENVEADLLSDSVPLEILVLPYEHFHLPPILKYDLNLAGYERKLSIKLSFEEVDSHTYVALKNNACVGFGIIRLSCLGTGQVGPLYADDPLIAEALLKKLILSLPQAKGFHTTTISSNKPANEIIQRLGCLSKECRRRLYRKEIVHVNTRKVFAVFSSQFSPF